MSASSEFQIYIKPGCPWCVDALAYLDEKGYSYQKIDVTADPAALQEMKETFGQTSAPSMTAGELKLADFGVDELIPFLEKHNLHP